MWFMIGRKEGKMKTKNIVTIEVKIRVHRRKGTDIV